MVNICVGDKGKGAFRAAALALAGLILLSSMARAGVMEDPDGPAASSARPGWTADADNLVLSLPGTAGLLTRDLSTTDTFLLDDLAAQLPYLLVDFSADGATAPSGRRVPSDRLTGEEKAAPKTDRRALLAGCPPTAPFAEASLLSIRAE